MPVLAENWTSVMAFLACETQWRVVATMSHLIFLGLDYTAVQVLATLDNWSTEIWRDIRTMEAAALPVLNEAD